MRRNGNVQWVKTCLRVSGAAFETVAVGVGGAGGGVSVGVCCCSGVVPWRCGLRGGVGVVAYEQCEGEGEDDDQCAEELKGDVPSQSGGQCGCQQWDDGAADADAEVGEAHGFAACAIEPAGEEDLIGQRAAADVAECVEQIEHVERGQRGGEAEACACGAERAEADQGEACHDDAAEHEASWTEAIDHPAGEEAEERADDQFAVGVAGRHFAARPSEVAHHEVVEERQSVQRDADDGEEGDEGGRRHVQLSGLVGRGHRVACRSLKAFSFSASGCDL